MDVFISYSRTHRYIAETLKEVLVEAGYGVWIDLDEIRGGELWELRIREEIKLASALLVVVTSPALMSQPILEEIKLAKEYGKEILPLIVERFDDEATALSILTVADRHAINFVVLGKQKGETQLLQTLRTISTSWNLIAPILPALKDVDKAVRRQAAKRLGETRSKQAMPFLIELLHDRDFSVVHEAAIALAEVGDERAIQPLIDLVERLRLVPFRSIEMDHRKAAINDIRFNTGIELSVTYAVIALATLEALVAVPRLTYWLQLDEPIFTVDTKCEIITALGSLADKSAVPIVANYIRSSDIDLRFCSVIALGLIGDSQAIPFLCSAYAEMVSEVEFLCDEGDQESEQSYNNCGVEEHFVKNEEMGQYLWSRLIAKHRITHPLWEQILDYGTISLEAAFALVFYVLGASESVPTLLRYLKCGDDIEPGMEAAVLAIGFLAKPNAVGILRDIRSQSNSLKPYLDAALSMLAGNEN